MKHGERANDYTLSPGVVEHRPVPKPEAKALLCLDERKVHLAEEVPSTENRHRDGVRRRQEDAQVHHRVLVSQRNQHGQHVLVRDECRCGSTNTGDWSRIKSLAGNVLFAPTELKRNGAVK